MSFDEGDVASTVLYCTIFKKLDISYHGLLAWSRNGSFDVMEGKTAQQMLAQPWKQPMQLDKSQSTPGAKRTLVHKNSE